MTPNNRELKSIAVHAEAVSYLLGQDSCTSKRLLCDEVCALPRTALTTIITARYIQIQFYPATANKLVPRLSRLLRPFHLLRCLDM